MSTLALTLTDVNGQLLKQFADVRLTHTSGKVSQVRAHAGRVNIGPLSDGPSETYEYQIRTKSYYPVGGFATVPSKGLELTLCLPIKATKVRSVTFPNHSSLPAEHRRLIDVATYAGLEDVERAGLLNILAKCNQERVLHHVLRIDKIKGDRLFCIVSPELLNAVHSSDRFIGASGALHEAPTGYKRIASFKSKDPYGNLQITAFAGKDDWLADIDIDDAAGLKHIYQVVRNTIHGATHPYNIHQILVGYQKLNPLYLLNA